MRKLLRNPVPSRLNRVWYWGHSIQRIYAIVYRHMISWPRDIDSLVDSFWWPSFDILLWGFMTVYIQNQQGHMPFITAYIIGAIILWAIVYRSNAEIGTLFLREFWDKNLLSIFATPLTITEFIASTIFIGCVKLVITGVYMAIVAYLVFSFNIFSFGLYLIPFLITLLLVGWWTAFIVMGLIVQYGWRISTLAWSFVVVLMPFSAVFFPLSILPTWMQSVARFVPTSYVFEGMRQVIATGSISWSMIILANILNIIYMILSCIFFAYSFRKAREKGMIVKFS